MWRATTDEEANFIFDLLDNREDYKAVENYVRWLEERDSVRAEFLRLQETTHGGESQLNVLRQQLDPRWLGVVTSRWFCVGDIVRITGGVFKGFEGTVREVDAQQSRAGLFLHLFCRQTELAWAAFTNLHMVQRCRWSS